MLEAYQKALDEGFFEVTEAFRGLADENVWKRPAAGLLSVGELAGHVAYWLAVRFAGEGGETEAELAKCRVSSPLIDFRFRYYPATIATPPSEQHLEMSEEEVCAELLKVYRDSVAQFRTLNPDLESAPPGMPDWTYASSLRYSVFHVAYHTGQMYSVRHLLGEETPDN